MAKSLEYIKPRDIAEGLVNKAREEFSDMANGMENVTGIKYAGIKGDNEYFKDFLIKLYYKHIGLNESVSKKDKSKIAMEIGHLLVRKGAFENAQPFYNVAATQEGVEAIGEIDSFLVPDKEK